MKKFSLLLTQIFIFPFMLFSNSVTSYENSAYRKIATLNMETVEWDDEEWDSQYYLDFLKTSMNNIRDPQSFRRKMCAFDLIGPLRYARHKNPAMLMDFLTLNDLEILCGTTNRQSYFGAHLNRTVTEIGTASFYTMLALPLTKVEEIKKRQEVIAKLVENNELFESLSDLYQKLKETEGYILAFAAKRTPLRQALQRNYFDIPASLNESATALELKANLGHYQRATFAVASGLACGVLSLHFLSYVADQKFPWLEKLKRRFHGSSGEIGPVLNLLSFASKKPLFHETLSAIGGIYSGLAVKSQLVWARDLLYLDSCIHEHMINVARYLKNAREIANTIRAHGELFNNIDSAATLCTTFEHPEECSSDVARLLELLDSNTFKGSPSFFSHRGKIMLAYKKMHEVKEDIFPIFEALGELDAYLSAAKLVKEFKSKPTSFCFTEFREAGTPIIELDEFWNPFINPKKVVANSLVLGTENNKRNIVVFGPNAGGKSSILGSVGLLVTLSQSFGIAPAKTAKLTPFSKLRTHRNIADDISSGNSLFKAEVQRAQEILDDIENCKDGEFIMVIMDEPLNGTTPREGAAAAYGFSHYIGSFASSMCLIATHFDLLTSLSHEGDYDAYKVSAIKEENTIRYIYKLEPGISDQHVALDIMRLSGFPENILTRIIPHLDQSDI